MTKGDLIYCYTCGGISIDINEMKSQDGRFNPRWNYRCGHCHGFKTINASQYLDSGHTTKMIALDIGNNPESLKAHGRLLKKQGIIKEFRVQAVRGKRFKLYERRRTKKEILKALTIWAKRKALNSTDDKYKSVNYEQQKV